MINREAIFAALFATVAGVPGLKTTSRKLLHWDRVSPADQPALFVTQGAMHAEAGYRRPTKWTLRASLYLYAHQNSLDILPSTALNQLIDAIELALAPDANGEQTLGLVAQTTPFARASTATYTDVNGVVQTAGVNVLRNQHYVNGVLQPPLIEGASSNLLTFTEAFDNAAWTKGNASVTPNATAAPDGNVTADTLVENTTPTVSHFLGQSVTLSPSTQYVKSVYAKPAGRNWIVLQIKDLAGTFKNAYFDVLNGVIGTTSGVTAVIAPAANGFFRCAISFSSATGVGAPNEAISTASANGVASYTGDGASGIHFWGAMTEIGTVPTSYIPRLTAAAADRAADIDQMLAATANGYSRQIGSFLTEGFRVGMKANPAAFGQNPVSLIKSVSDLAILTDPAPPALDPAVAGRSISFGLPIGSGSVSHCRIAGEIETDEGVLGDQAIAIIPIEIQANA